MDPSRPGILICCRVLLVHALPSIAPENIFSNAGVISVCGGITIIGFISGGKKETSLMVCKLKMFWSNFLLLVKVSVSVSLVRLPCASLAVYVFNSYLELFIFKLLISLTSLSDLSIFSPVNIASKFYLC